MIRWEVIQVVPVIFLSWAFMNDMKCCQLSSLLKVCATAHDVVRDQTT